MSGSLFIVATPIGNLGDISARAISTLQETDLVFAEDTRKFKILAARFEIKTQVTSFHEQNEKKVTPWAIEKLKSGAIIAVVSEAGTPTISDPGYRLVCACRKEGIPVIPVPGPSALIAALSVSGLETNRFLFEGFLPYKKAKREKMLQRALESNTTTIFYESPYRILSTLELIETLEPGRSLFLGRELTKKFEQSVRGTASEIIAALSVKKKQKGEFVLIIGCRGKNEPAVSF